MKDKICVIIPVHQEAPNKTERISLEACRKVLNHLDCYLVYPKNISPYNYVNIFPELHCMPLDDVWFKNVLAYNRMKTDICFYNKFCQYEYMLTYELDAYIFSADFDKNNILEYDYIGAPFFKGYAQASFDATFIKGGNSGFSIRNIEKTIDGLKFLMNYQKKWKFQFACIRKIPLLKPLLTLTNWKYLELFENDHFIGFMRKGYFHEDIILSQLLPIIYPHFRVAPPEKALTFSFEVHADKLYVLNGNSLPNGCHAWHLYQEFWKKHINAIN